MIKGKGLVKEIKMEMDVGRTGFKRKTKEVGEQGVRDMDLSTKGLIKEKNRDER